MAERKAKIHNMLEEYVQKISEEDLDKILDVFISDLLKVKNCNKNISYHILRQEESSIYKVGKKLLESLNTENLDKPIEHESFEETLNCLLTFYYEMNTNKSIGHISIVRNSFFIYIFSIFDYFITTMQKYLYRNNTQLLGHINKEINLLEIVKYNDISDLMNSLIERSLDSFRRESYIDQFNILEKRFNIKLKKFHEWEKFVEISQRRNILTHCGGIITNQYLENCKKENVNTANYQLGSRLEVSNDYLNDSIDTLMITGVMLIFTLKRKQTNDNSEISELDDLLNSIVYDLLRNEEHFIANRIADFALSQRKVTASNLKFFEINKGIALFNLNDHKSLKAHLDNIDWSIIDDELRISKEVLYENYDEALDLLKKIGNSGNFITEHSYIEWPLFKPLHENSKYKKIYNELFSKNFDEELEKLQTSNNGLDELNNLLKEKIPQVNN